MSSFDYTYVFGELGSGPIPVHITNHRTGTTHIVSTYIDNELLMEASLDSKAEVEIALDVLSIAVAVHVADYLTVRTKDKASNIRLCIPMWHVGRVDTAMVKELLSRTLGWYTNDLWHFEWNHRSETSQVPAFQTTLDIFDEAKEIALWSGGLDSLAGLLTRISEGTAREYFLVGTGASDLMTGVQRHTASAVATLYPSRTHLVQAPFSLMDAAELPKNSLQRSRGFTFVLIGAVCAWRQKQNCLHIYENGIGAINLPYRASEVGLDHSRSVHPASLLRMESLLKHLLPQPISVVNPFLFVTKGQMCEIFNHIESNQCEMIRATVSCDSLHRQPNLPAQCGYCSSCLLRRQALIANGLEDKTRYSILEMPFRSHYCLHLRVMLKQVETIKNSLESNQPWTSLLQHFPMLDDVLTPKVIAEAGTVETAIQRLLAMYDRYVSEWSDSSDIIENTLTPKTETISA